MHHSRSGFTIVELLVIIAVMVIIATVTLVYNGSGRNEVNLSVQSAKIAGLLLQAKQLAIASYDTGSSLVCGYGVYFDIPNQAYSLFAYSPQGAAECPDLSTLESSSTWLWHAGDAAKYSAEVWQVPIPAGLTMTTGTVANPSVETVIFYPPNPATVMVSADNGKNFESTSTLYVDLQTVDGQAKASISISPAGQVNF